MKLRDLLRLSLMLAMIVAGRFARDAEQSATAPKRLLATPTPRQQPTPTNQLLTTSSATATLQRAINYN